MERNSKEEGKRKRIQVNFKIKGNWYKKSDALKKMNPKLNSEEMISEFEKEPYLFI